MFQHHVQLSLLFFVLHDSSDSYLIHSIFNCTVAGGEDVSSFSFSFSA